MVSSAQYLDSVAAAAEAHKAYKAAEAAHAAAVAAHDAAAEAGVDTDELEAAIEGAYIDLLDARDGIRAAESEAYVDDELADKVAANVWNSGVELSRQKVHEVLDIALSTYNTHVDGGVCSLPMRRVLLQDIHTLGKVLDRFELTD